MTDSNQTTSNRAFDLLLILPLEEEMKEMLGAFEYLDNLSTAYQLRYALKPINGLSVLAVLQETMGYSSAAKACDDAFASYQFNVVITCGIAGSLSNDVRLGDVCYTGTIFDIYNNAKVSDGRSGGIAFESAPDAFQTDRTLSAPLSFVRVMPEINQVYLEWREFQALVASEKCPSPVTGRDGRKETLGEPVALEGALACGHVTKSENYNSALRAIHRNMLAIETESGAVFRFASRHGLQCMTIRGISDYANRTKGELEEESKGAVRGLAASNACSFLRLQFDNPYFVAAVENLRSPNQLPPVALPKLPENPLPAMLEQLTGEIDAKLRELSPEYRSKPVGYRLPTPRVKQVGDSASQLEMSVEEEIWSTLKSQRLLLVRVPRNFPDRSLAWVIANDLLSREIGDERLLPVTISGHSISPPKSGLSKACGIDLSAAPPPGAKYVVIIDDLPTMAAARLKYLVGELSAHAHLSFVILGDEERNPIAFSDFAARTQSQVYDISEISFAEITSFLQRHYDMPGTTAEVIAYRLHGVFSKYNMQAHPTFFAGIPPEALVSILDTNARSELIQLAVFGYLSLVVATDRDKVRVNRTTRLDFLRTLVREIKVEKRSFAQADLIKFADEFSRKFALGIQPIQFINCFFDCGVLRMDGDTTQFSLPFFEAYILAVELAEDPATAVKYFNVWDDNFDSSTFDIYAEVSANTDIVTNLGNALDRALSDFAGQEQNVIFSTSIKAPMFEDSSSLEKIQGGLKTTEQNVRTNRSETGRKQKYLDMISQITRTAKAEIVKLESERGPENSEETGIALVVIMRVWQIAVTFLGSGAERIPAKEKVELTTKTLELADFLVDRWTRAQLAIDFSDLTARALTSEEIDALRSDIDFNGSDTEIEKLVATLKNLTVASIIAGPLNYCLSHISEQARNSALSVTLAGTKTDTPLAEIMRTIWLFNVDPERGKPVMDKTFAKTPRAPFFIMSMLSYFLFHIYWTMPEEKWRLALIDTSNRLLKPLNRKLPKEQVARALKSIRPN